MIASVRSWGRLRELLGVSDGVAKVAARVRRRSGGPSDLSASLL